MKAAGLRWRPFLNKKTRRNLLYPIDIIHQMMYNKTIDKGKSSNEERRREPTQKGGERMEEEAKIKELLEVLEKALQSETVERITITIKPNQKPKQS